MKHVPLTKQWFGTINPLIEPFIVFASSVAISALLLTRLLPKIFNLRESLFSGSDTILITPTSDLWIDILIALPAFLVGFAATALWILQRGNSPARHCFPMSWRSVSVASAVVGAVFWVGMLSYCRIDTYGVYLRGAGTLLQEHYYPWNSVREVRFLSEPCRNSDPRVECALVRYVLDLGSASVDLLEERVRDNSDKIHIIHTIVMDEMVPFVRDVAYLDDDSMVLVHRIETGYE